MSLKTCSDTSEADALESSLGLYLKPVSRIKINVQLPKLSHPGQSISSWHVMEKLKATVRPDTFLYLKALKITATVIKFEGELETKSSCDRALARLRATGCLKLSGFTERLQIRAAHSTATGPTRHDWEAFFRDAKGVNEMKPGERPDTIHLQDMPLRWFAEGGKTLNPSEKILRKAFGTFGKIRRLEIPAKTESGGSAFGKTSSLHNDLLFEAYIQYEEYVEFAIAMDSLRGKKLLYKETDGKVYSADIKVDFDRTKYLSDKCINRRVAEEKKLNPTPSNEMTTVSVKDEVQQQCEQVLKAEVAPDEKLIPKVKSKEAYNFSEDQKKAQIEAKHLLKELLQKAEKSERHKEQMNELHITQKQHGSQKRPEESISSERKHKKIKTSKEKDAWTPNSKEKGKLLHIQDEEKVVHKKEKDQEKLTHLYSPEKKNKDIMAHTKRKKTEEKLERTHEGKWNMEKGSSNKERSKEKMPKHIEEKNKKRSSKHKSEMNDDPKKRRNSDGKNKEKKTSAGYEESTNERKISTHHEKVKSKEKCALTKDEKKKNKEKQIEMRIEEKKIKDRLIQAYNEHKKNKEKLIEQERILKEKLLRNLREREEQKLKIREKLRKELAGRKVLKSVLASTNSLCKKNYSS